MKPLWFPEDKDQQMVGLPHLCWQTLWLFNDRTVRNGSHGPCFCSSMIYDDLPVLKIVTLHVYAK